MNLKTKILKIVKNIKKGTFLRYKDVAEKSGNKKSYRMVGKILSENINIKIPCHRVIKNDYTIGEYNIKITKLRYKNKIEPKLLKVGLLLKEGVIVIMPTDTIYGICTSAFNKKSVARVYKLKRRRSNKPFIILISDVKELKNFGIKLNKKEKILLNKIWPSKISIIFNIKDKKKIRKFYYLHRGTKTLAFRLPKCKWLLNILKISGPLIAPSANWEGYKPAKNIKEAKRYFGENVIYLDKKVKLSKNPSTLIKINKKIEILRKGADFIKLKNVII